MANTKDEQTQAQPTGFPDAFANLTLEQELAENGIHGTPQPISTARVVGAPPLPPSSGSGPQSGILSPALGLQTDVASAGSQPASVPSYRLMPVAPAGVSQGNAAAQSNIVKNSVVIANTKAAAAAQSTANAALAAAQASVFSGAWSPTVNYITSNQVTYGDDYYIALQSSLNQEPDTSPTYWQLVSSPSTQEFLGAWSNSTAYVAGNQVTENGSYYICILANTNESPSSSPTYWTLVGTSALFIGVYSGGTAYVTGNQITYNGAFYTCIAPTTGNAPTNLTYWQIVGTASLFLGAYNSGTAYVIGNEVSFNGNLYSCVVNSTGNAPTNQTYWQFVGPSNSVQVVGSPSFTYASTTTTITISWNNFSILLPNGQSIPVSNGSQVITGLTSGTAYTFFPYYNYTSGAIDFVSASSVSLPTLAGVSVAAAGNVTTTTALSVNHTSAQISVEFWLYPTAGTICSLVELNSTQTGSPGGSFGPQVAMDLFGGSGAYQIACNGSSSGSGTVFGGTLINNFWNYVVVTFGYGSGSGGSTEITIYVNGVQTSGVETTISSTNYYWRIATGADGAASGIFSRVAIYETKVLTATQVASHFAAMLQSGSAAFDTLVTQDGATYYWKLAETTGTSAADSIGSNTGTYTGTFTLNDPESIGGSNGSPSIAWQSPPLVTTIAQYSQNQIPLSAGGVQASTTASSTGGGVIGGFVAPALPPGLNYV